MMATEMVATEMMATEMVPPKMVASEMSTEMMATMVAIPEWHINGGQIGVRIEAGRIPSIAAMGMVSVTMPTDMNLLDLSFSYGKISAY
jgi:hypothetical protein